MYKELTLYLPAKVSYTSYNHNILGGVVVLGFGAEWFLWNVGMDLQNLTAPKPKTPPPSY
jgi:hypothetical protein